MDKCRPDHATDSEEDVRKIWSKSFSKVLRYFAIREVYVRKQDFEKIMGEWLFTQTHHTRVRRRTNDTFRVRVFEIDHAQVKVDGCKYHLLQQNQNT